MTLDAAEILLPQLSFKRYGEDESTYTRFIRRFDIGLVVEWSFYNGFSILLNVEQLETAHLLTQAYTSISDEELFNMLSSEEQTIFLYNLDLLRT